jgi:hypothetical protein
MLDQMSITPINTPPAISQFVVVKANGNMKIS